MKSKLLKRQKFGLFIFLIVLLGFLLFKFTDIMHKSAHSELDVLLIPSITFGFLFSSYKLLKKPESEIYRIYNYKEIFYKFCGYFLTGVSVSIMLLAIFFTYRYLIYNVKCWLFSSNNCELNISVYHFIYSSIFIIIYYGYTRKIITDKQEIIEEYNERLERKEKRIEELGQKLKKSVYTDEKITDWEYLDN